jgi:hypothetical protein
MAAEGVEVDRAVPLSSHPRSAALVWGTEKLSVSDSASRLAWEREKESASPSAWGKEKLSVSDLGSDSVWPSVPKK